MRGCACRRDRPACCIAVGCFPSRRIRFGECLVSSTRSFLKSESTQTKSTQTKSTQAKSTQAAPSRPPKAARQPARVAFVGAGPGDPGLVTLRAAEYLAEADVVIIDQVSREEFVARYARPDVVIIDAGHGEQGQPLTHASRAKLLVKAAKAAGTASGNGLVVRLMDGDPAMFNGLSEEAIACRRAGIAFEVVPGVSAICAVPSYAGVPLTS